MPTTLEVRWFQSGAPPPALRDWLQALEPDPPHTWTDTYLPTDDPGVNVKIREDRLQIKRRTAEPVRRAFTADVSGQVERWTKWSFELASGIVDPSAHEWGDLWIPVQKTRQQREFDAEDLRSMEIGESPSSDTVVLVELTTLAVRERPAWTLCIEAEGPHDHLEDPFVNATRALFHSNFPISLPLEQSFGYVRLLQQEPGITAKSTDEISLS